MGCGIRIEFVEIGHPHGEISIGEELDRLGFSRIGEEDRDIVLDGVPA